MIEQVNIPTGASSMPLVSICIPVYNGADYLTCALQSACGQTYLKTEIIVVDNASTDETHAIAANFAVRDPRVRIVRNDDNLGMVGNWNRCLELAQGEWIKFLCHDDLLASDCLERMLQANTANNDVVICARKFLIEPNADPKLQKFFTTGIISFQELGLTGSISPAQVAAAMSKVAPLYNFLGEPNCILFRRRCVAEVGTFHPWFALYSDFDYWLRLAVTRSITVVPEPLASFRVHGGSTTAKTLTQQFRNNYLDPLLLIWLFLNNPKHRKFLQQYPIVRHKWQERMRLLLQEIRCDEEMSHLFDTWLTDHPEAPHNLGKLSLATNLRLTLSQLYWQCRHAWRNWRD
jgi:glycosyltransferase involved in cell wall biosynthesis